MNLIVCTLFEGHYHLGLIALTNSLHSQGFRGAIYAGYRGSLPDWADKATPCENVWAGGRCYEVADGVQIYFLPLTTTYDLTNYKPDFMLNLLEIESINAQGAFYFDPDIVVSAPWSFFTEWIGCGIALCEDVNSPLPSNHPRRVAWRNYFGDNGLNLKFKDCIYVNGGFIGVQKADFEFLHIWKEVQEKMALKIGGLDRSIFSKIPMSEETSGPFAPFGKTDQDALNATVEAWDGNVSFVGQEGMAFKPGVPQMTHALGTPKPWHINHITYALAGRPPRRVDRDYWQAMSGPIKYYSNSRISIKKTSLLVAAFIGRFYKRFHLY
ncbi:MAG: hypothetical protein Q7T76_02235 [Ferruginibacter sp.]|nr:hypothetical protein [Ferruginibacter sp.]